MSYGLRMRDDSLGLARETRDLHLAEGSLFVTPPAVQRAPRLRSWRALAPMGGIRADAECSTRIPTGQTLFPGLVGIGPLRLDLLRT